MISFREVVFTHVYLHRWDYPNIYPEIAPIVVWYNKIIISLYQYLCTYCIVAIPYNARSNKQVLFWVHHDDIAVGLLNLLLIMSIRTKGNFPKSFTFVSLSKHESYGNTFRAWCMMKSFLNQQSVQGVVFKGASVVE